MWPTTEKVKMEDRRAGIKAYCRICGTKLTKEELNTFNEYTGEKEFQLVCPTKSCEHDHDWQCIKTSALSKLFKGYKCKCTRCQKIIFKRPPTGNYAAI